MRTAADLLRRAWHALVKELGLVDALRYRLLFEGGRGDYAHERAALFGGLTLADWLRDLAEWESRREAQGEAATSQREQQGAEEDGERQGPS
jgi:hypothetical protein